MRKLFLVVTILAVTGCANLSAHDRNTIAGASIGAVSGAVLAGGGFAVVGGAAVGGIIGHEIKTRR